MEKYISLIIFIAPGFVARYIIDKFMDKDEIKSDFEKTIVSLLYGLPIFFIAFVFMIFTDKIYGIQQLKECMNDFSFIIKYIVIIIISTIIFSFFTLLYQLKISKCIEMKIRKIFNLREISQNDNGWKEFFSEKESRIIGVYKGKEELAIGLLKNNTTNNSKRSEIILDEESITKEMKEYLNVKKVYINLDKDIILKEYKINDGGVK